MNKFFIVLAHTYLSKLKSKSFLISTAITLLFIFGFMNFDRIITMFDQDQKESSVVLVLDETGQLFEPLKHTVSQINPTVELKDFGGSYSEAETLVIDQEVEGMIELSLGDTGLPEGKYYAMTVVEQILPWQLEQALQQVKEEIVTSGLNLQPEEVASIYAPIQFERVAIAETAKTEMELNQARIFVYILLFIIYFSVLMFGNMIATEIAIEKSSRVMEILISSSSPVQQMFGKIFGIALLGLTQYVLIFLVGVLSLRQRLSTDSFDQELGELIVGQGLPLHLIGYAFLFFILGYFLYATISAMLGSLVSRIEDVNQMVSPMIFLIVAAFLIAMFGLSNPEAKIVTVTSFIPFFAPMIMFLRVGMLSLPLWEVLLGVAILIVTIVLFAWVGARVYRGGVLMYGKSSSLKDFKRALQLSKREK
ncbi:ABC transporter permease [Alkalihalobacterium chitinilyticum]|uniref:ABC transporter permease n=1 Tax=Alkalihalobacterium chitinilyticum TaxID=2980103 RepID=A0ABT5VHM2_9BACI|nr:ABC transporter permease [Alkalihalobacterium chitinilyticum]MDE5414955.1 ABC transporter permease [Alkalihalobacterium chitinilyticum]